MYLSMIYTEGTDKVHMIPKSVGTKMTTMSVKYTRIDQFMRGLNVNTLPVTMIYSQGLGNFMSL